MAVGEGSSSPDDNKKSLTENDETQEQARDPPASTDHPDPEGDNEAEEEDDDDEEPRLKYANLTKNLVAIYRGGDAASAFFVAGEKLIIGTDKGNVSVLSLPGLDVLKRYQAHSASVTAISISPYPPPLPTLRLEPAQRLVSESLQPDHEASPARSSPASKDSPRQPAVPQTAANQIYIATSSIDGKVCVQSLVDPKDVQLRNFGRPVQTVALSPEYRSDRTYLSGGNAGSLVLTVGGQLGKETNATTTGAAAAASGWFGSVGLGSDTGTDRVLHGGEGNISNIRWSLSGKFVLWVNEQGIKVMRSNLHVTSAQAGMEWKRISHIDRPNRPVWEDMAGAWKARVEWIDRNNLESDDRDSGHDVDTSSSSNGNSGQSNQGQKLDYEEVTIGWGDSIWMVRVYPGDEDASKPTAGSKPRAEVATM
jgi:vacuolar protein sorting-associated protein 41